jgi:hypothetical protein
MDEWIVSKCREGSREGEIVAAHSRRTFHPTNECVQAPYRMHALTTNEFSEDVRMFLSRAYTQQNKHTKP